MSLKISIISITIFFILNIFSYNCFSINNHDKPLILTDYIEHGEAVRAQKLSRVTKLDGTIEQHLPMCSGFFNVNRNTNSNLFFWLFLQDETDTNKPFIIWVGQNGPGSSSLFGQFVETGYIKSSPDGKTEFREIHWSKKYSVLYIDSIAYSGFSFSQNPNYQNEKQIGNELFEAIKQFYLVYHFFKNDPLYIVGEFYGTKHAVELAYEIWNQREQSIQDMDINLKGLLLGSAWIDPRNMLEAYGPALYQMKLINEAQRDYIVKQTKQAQDLIDQKQYKDAKNIFFSLMIDDKSYFTNITGLKFPYNIHYKEEPKEFSYYEKFLDDESNCFALHVGDLHFKDNRDDVLHMLENDFMASVKPQVEELLQNNIRMLFYGGNLNALSPFVAVENSLIQMNWPGQAQYKNTPIENYMINGNVVGQIKKTANLVHVEIFNAGQMVPYDQPETVYEMIQQFIK